MNERSRKLTIIASVVITAIVVAFFTLLIFAGSICGDAGFTGSGS